MRQSRRRPRTAPRRLQAHPPARTPLLSASGRRPTTGTPTRLVLTLRLSGRGTAARRRNRAGRGTPPSRTSSRCCHPPRRILRAAPFRRCRRTTSSRSRRSARSGARMTCRPRAASRLLPRLATLSCAGMRVCWVPSRQRASSSHARTRRAGSRTGARISLALLRQPQNLRRPLEATSCASISWLEHPAPYDFRADWPRCGHSRWRVCTSFFLPSALLMCFRK